jgi:predicted nucleotidyltransferase
MERKLAQLVERLKGAYTDRLVAVILYGSAAGGDHHLRFSDLNVLCVLKGITPRELAEAGPILRWWREQGNPAPLLLSAEEARNATDCFPIEFHDIQERRRVLYGEDVVAGVEIDECFYRAQVEHELRAKLLRLRQKAAGVLSDKELLRGLLADSVSTFCVLFRHALRLAGHEAPFEKRAILARAQEKFGIDPWALERLLDLREGKIRPRELDPGPLLAAYLAAIERVTVAVDSLEK